VYARAPLSLGEVQTVKGSQIIHQALVHGGGSGSGLTQNKDIVLISTGSSIVYKILRSAAPVGDGLLLEGEVIGLLNPLAICVTGFLIIIVGFNGISGPPVTHDDFHTTQIIYIAVLIGQNRVRAYLLLRGRCLRGRCLRRGRLLRGRCLRRGRLLRSGRIGCVTAGSRRRLIATCSQAHSHHCSQGRRNYFLCNFTFHFSYPPV